jgi:hypothetical protein
MRRVGLAVVLAVGLTLAPHAADAQQAGRMPRTGYLGTRTPSDFGLDASVVAQFHQPPATRSPASATRGLARP